MNVFIHEIKRYTKSTIVWTVTLSAIVVVFMLMYPAFSKNAEEVKKMLMGFPIEVRKAFSVSIELITSPIGYYAYLFVYISLCGAIQAMNLGVSLLSKEAHEKTVDFLLSKPITRWKTVFSKLCAALSCIVFTNIIYWGCTYVSLLAVADTQIDNKLFVLINASLIFIQIIFLSLGLLLSTIISKIKSSIFVSLGAVFLFFIISMVGEVIDDEISRYLTPFQYFNTEYIIFNREYEMPFILTSVAVILISVAVGFIVYSKKDIHAV